LVKDQKNSHFVNDLREGSALLKYIHQQFERGFELKDCEIISFYETKDTRTVVVCFGNTPILSIHLMY
jgi:hypothetical protein